MQTKYNFSRDLFDCVYKIFKILLIAVMPQENETIQVELLLSNENKQLLLKYFPTGTMHVATLEIDGEIDQSVCLKL